jgi:hypothetical protein
MEAIIEFLTVLGSLSPLAVIALLGTVIFLLVKGKTSADEKIETVASNHLHDLPEMCESLKRIEGLLEKINDKVTYVQARVNGGGPGPRP